MDFLPVPRITTWALLEELGDSLHHDVAALLLLETADVAEDGGGGVEGEANLSLERLLGGSLAHDDGVLVVGDVEELVGGGVPLGGVHAVDDALDAAGGVDDGVELDTLGRGAGDLLGVVHGHGDVAIGVDEGSLHPVVLAELLAGGGRLDLAILLGVALVVHLALRILKEEVVGGGLGEAVVAHLGGPEAALEGDVVHGEGAPGVEVLACRGGAVEGKAGR